MGYGGQQIQDLTRNPSLGAGLGSWYTGQQMSDNKAAMDAGLVEQWQKNEGDFLKNQQTRQMDPLKLEEQKLRNEGAGLQNTGQGIQNDTGKFNLTKAQAEHEMGIAKKFNENTTAIAAMIQGLPSEELAWETAKREYGRTPQGQTFFNALEQRKNSGQWPMGKDGKAIPLHMLLGRTAEATNELSQKAMLQAAAAEAKAEIFRDALRSRERNVDATNASRERIANVTSQAQLEGRRIVAEAKAGGPNGKMTLQNKWSEYFEKSMEALRKDPPDQIAAKYYSELADYVRKAAQSWGGPVKGSPSFDIDPATGQGTVVVKPPAAREGPGPLPMPPAGVDLRKPAQPGAGLPSDMMGPAQPGTATRTGNARVGVKETFTPQDSNVPRASKSDVQNIMKLKDKMKTGDPIYVDGMLLYKQPNGQLSRVKPE